LLSVTGPAALDAELALELELELELPQAAR
jgi:hypothetical protein